MTPQLTTLDSATTLGKLLYCSVVLHRFRKSRSRGTYTPAQVESGLDPGYTAYNPAGAPPNPFRFVLG